MKHKEEIVAYLDRYSSKSEPKSISEIAETLSIDEESVGYVVHDLLAMNALGIEKSPDKYNFLYYIIHHHQHHKN